jgi:high-affinity Fe2+/Pb2+ permease
MASRRQRPTQVSKVSSKISSKISSKVSSTVSSLLTHARDVNEQLRSLLYAIYIYYITYIYILCMLYVYFIIHIYYTYIIYIVYILYILLSCAYICLQPVILWASYTTIYVSSYRYMRPHRSILKPLNPLCCARPTPFTYADVC